MHVITCFCAERRESTRIERFSSGSLKLHSLVQAARSVWSGVPTLLPKTAPQSVHSGNSEKGSEKHPVALPKHSSMNAVPQNCSAALTRVALWILHIITLRFHHDFRSSICWSSAKSPKYCFAHFHQLLSPRKAAESAVILKNKWKNYLINKKLRYKIFQATLGLV